MRHLLSVAVGLLLLASASESGAQTAPQFSIEDLEGRFSGTEAAPTAPPASTGGDCEAQGMVTGADGSCQPKLSGRRGFSLSAPEPAAKPAARPAPAPRAASGRRPAARPAPERAVAAAPVAPRGFDLLITFENNSFNLTEQARANAKVFADALQRRPLRRARFAIEGHTDAVGSRALNQKLSEERAAALVDFLVAEGVERSRFEVRGYGFSQPLGRDPMAPENRRVEARRVS